MHYIHPCIVCYPPHAMGCCVNVSCLIALLPYYRIVRNDTLIWIDALGGVNPCHFTSHIFFWSRKMRHIRWTRVTPGAWRNAAATKKYGRIKYCKCQGLTPSIIFPTVWSFSFCFLLPPHIYIRASLTLSYCRRKRHLGSNKQHKQSQYHHQQKQKHSSKDSAHSLTSRVPKNRRPLQKQGRKKFCSGFCRRAQPTSGAFCAHKWTISSSRTLPQPWTDVGCSLRNLDRTCCLE